MNQWPNILSGKPQPRTLPTTHKSLLHDDGQGHMWKLINGNETRADRFHANGSVYEDPFHECLPGHVNESYGLHARAASPASAVTEPPNVAPSSSRDPAPPGTAPTR